MPDGYAAARWHLAVDSPHQVGFTWVFADEEAVAKTKNPHGPRPPGPGLLHVHAGKISEI